jgi:hypothetical protein
MRLRQRCRGSCLRSVFEYLWHPRAQLLSGAQSPPRRHLGSRGAEIFSRRLGERIADGYEARYRRYADPAGNAPSGFRRQPEPPHLLEIDPEAIGRIVEMFEKYSRGDMSFERLGSEYGILAEGARKIIMNPIYNGWAVRASRRHGRGRPEERVPARWRGNPPVSDELWERAIEVRRLHSRGGGPRRHEKFDPLAGLIFCKCGRDLRADGFDGSGRHRRQHPNPCPPWGERRRYTTDTWYRPLLAQVGSLRLDNATIERVVRPLKATSSRPDELRRKRFERRRRDLALDHAAGRVGDAEYMAAVTALRAAEIEAPAPRRWVDAATAVRRLRDFGALWASRTEAQRAEMLREVYARIEVRGPEFIAAHLTPDAAELGLTVALPENGLGCYGVPGRIRTCDLPLRRRLLCPLSYGDAIGWSVYARNTRIDAGSPAATVSTPLD